MSETTMFLAAVNGLVVLVIGTLFLRALDSGDRQLAMKVLGFGSLALTILKMVLR